MGRNRAAPPHVRIQEERAWRDRHDAEIDALEAQYGVPYEKLPAVLRHAAPEHPQRSQVRRFGYLTRTAYNYYRRSRRDRRRLVAAPGQTGWRAQRAAYLRDLETRRNAEIEVRKSRIKRGGRGKVLPKNLREQSRDAVERRELREGAW